MFFSTSVELNNIMFYKGIISHIFGLDMLAGRVNRTVVAKETVQKVFFLSLCSDFCFDCNKVQSHTIISKFSLFEVFS